MLQRPLSREESGSRFPMHLESLSDETFRLGHERAIKALRAFSHQGRHGGKHGSSGAKGSSIARGSPG